jgi:paraquat-inducible protein A
VPSTSITSLICLNCDTVHRPVSLGKAEIAHCSYCGAVLARKHDMTAGQLLAVTLAAAILFMIANVTSVLDIEFSGVHTEANVWLAVLSLDHGWIFWAALALALTMFLIPMLQITLLLWVLAFASVALRAPAYRYALILLHHLRPWSMTEVFLLGALVAIVKLSAWVHIVAGEGIWAIAGLTILLAILSRFDSRAWWEFVERARP